MVWMSVKWFLNSCMIPYNWYHGFTDIEIPAQTRPILHLSNVLLRQFFTLPILHPSNFAPFQSCTLPNHTLNGWFKTIHTEASVWFSNIATYSRICWSPSVNRSFPCEVSLYSALYLWISRQYASSWYAFRSIEYAKWSATRNTDNQHSFASRNRKCGLQTSHLPPL